MSSNKSQACKAVHPDYEFCVPHNAGRKPPHVHNASPKYNALLQNILTHCEPYDGEKVFVVFANGMYKLVCPTYKIKLARRWYSISVASNGFMYIHLLRNFVPNTKDCVYSGSHVTIGPHMRSNTHLHFHITNVDVTSKDGKMSATKQNHAICSISYSHLMNVITEKEHQKQRFEQLTCIQDDMTLRDIVWDGVRFDQIDETVDMLLSLLKKGTSPHKSS
jgi:hypothetical protein